MRTGATGALVSGLMNSDRKRLSQMTSWPISRPQSEEERSSSSCHLSYAISIILVTMCSCHWWPHNETSALCGQVEAPSLPSSPPMKAAKGYRLSTKSGTWWSFIITTLTKVSNERSQEDILSTPYTCKMLKTEENGQEPCLTIKVPSKGIDALVVWGLKST